MADTARTKAELIALFAANTTNEISSQDFRDLIMTVVPSHGAQYVSASAATTVTVAGTYYKAAGTTTATTLDGFTMPANNRLQYSGTPTVHVRVTCSISFTTASNSQVCGFRVAKNGDATTTDAVASTTRRKTGTGTDVGALNLNFDSTLSNGDYLELWLTNETTNSTVTIDNMYMMALTLISTD